MLKVIDGVKLDFNDVLIRPNRSYATSRNDIKLNRTFRFYHSNREWWGFPLMVANMDCVGTMSMSDSLRPQQVITCLHKHHEPSNIIDAFSKPYSLPYTWYSTGITNDDLVKLKAVLAQRAVNICVDVANGYMHSFVEKVAEIRGLVGDGPIIMAGNVCTPEMVQDLIVNGGADIVKIGIGPGSACTTRKITGVGFPQLSAIAECANVAHGLCREKGRVGLICADGGCKTSGDIAKAYGAGADFVMVGGMLAGTLESDGMWETEPMAGGNSLMKNPPPHVKRVRFTYYGMSSEDAQNKYSGGLAEYKSSEGKRITVPYKGPAVDVVKQIKGGLRSACSYVGATCLKDFNKCCTFVRVR